jgi:AraC family transcriptional regulator of adaptative response / DNA-3-methyladenine glycosylase II
LRRDVRFDGLFFTGVKTTGIYCRPVCPVKPAHTKNVTYFQSAPAAERAGFRPCLRCRPETAPFCPAWKGTKTTVERALKLIDEGVLDSEPVDCLAARLGVGTRHLARLFQRHIGASPLQTAKTFRVQRAKRLLNQTALPMTEIAFRSGFKSVRRFNSVFLELYGRAPSKMRRGAKPRTERKQSLYRRSRA